MNAARWINGPVNMVELRLIQPGKAIQNEFIKSFNGRFRAECLNEHWVSDVLHT